MNRKYILALDQGTTGSRAFICDTCGVIVASDYREFCQYFPKAGWVEHDAVEIWKSCVAVIKGALGKAQISGRQIAAIGITNQRETVVLWDRKTAKPVARAIVWQCRRTAEICKDLSSEREVFRQKTGLVLDPYFSGTKIKWLLQNVKGLKARVKKGEICFGTIDSWLIWKLTGGQSHVTDMTNASRTLLFNIRDLKWDSQLMKILDVPKSILPQVQNSGSIFGKTAKNQTGLPSGIPISAVLGDQQAALYGQGCFTSGTMKNTYGTGCFLVLNTGKKLILSNKGLLSTIASDDLGQPLYAMEGSIFIAGAVIQWLRDQLGVIDNAAQTEAMIKGIRDTQGVYFVPAFTGLGAPYWDAQARGMICGLTRGSNVKHITRAALESIAYQTKDVFDVMRKEFKMSSPRKLALKVDGGACENNFLMQFQADMLGCPVIRPKVIDSTAVGAAYLAGVTVGIWNGKKDLEKLQKTARVFTPKMTTTQQKKLYTGWQHAVGKVM